MKRILGLLLALVMLVSVCACGHSPSAQEETPTWQEQYDLGLRWLTDGNCAEAVIAFTTAIEIDPKRPEAYLSLACAYIGQNDFENAEKILGEGVEATGDDSLRQKLDELLNGDITDYEGRKRRIKGYDASGTLTYYADYTYKDGRTASVTSYSADGTQTGHVDLAYDADGHMLTGFTEDPKTGRVVPKLFEYDENGDCVFSKILSDSEVLTYSEYNGQHQVIREEHRLVFEAGEEQTAKISYFEYSASGKETKRSVYDNDGNLRETHIREYDEQDRQIRYSVYDGAGALRNHTEFLYDETGKAIRREFDSTGNLLRSTEY